MYFAKTTKMGAHELNVEHAVPCYNLCLV